MEFIALKMQRQYVCPICHHIYDNEQICCRQPCIIQYDTDGRTDSKYMQVLLPYEPIIGRINIYNFTYKNKNLLSKQLQSTCLRYATALTRSLLPTNSNLHVTTAFLVIVCLFCRVDVQIPVYLREFAVCCVNSLIQLQTVTQSIVKLDYNGVNCIYIYKNGNPQLHFTDKHLLLRITDQLMNEKQQYQVQEDQQQAKDSILELSKQLHNCQYLNCALKPQIDQIANQKQLYELNQVSSGIARLCGCDIDAAVIEYAEIVLQNIALYGIFGLEKFISPQK